MAQLIELEQIVEAKGSLVAINKVLPFEIRRVYYIFGTPEDVSRGGHKHIKNIQGLICVQGSCAVEVDNEKIQGTYVLDRPNKCLILYPEDWHVMNRFTRDAILLVLASEYYDPTDYIYRRGKNA
jgi:hypothetical protein